MKSNIWRWGNLFRYLTIRELVVFFLGKLSNKIKGQDYLSLLEKKNKIDFLYGTGVKKLKFLEGNIIINHKVHQQKVRILIRVKGSDAFVFKQILIDQEFKFVLELFEKEFRNKPHYIVDAGSNIGCSTLYFSLYNRESKILCVEPSNENITLAAQNINNNNCSSNVILHQKALWSKKEKLSISKDFRDGSDWSLTMVRSDVGLVESILPTETFTSLDTQVIDLFKIDIEGGEAEIFGIDSNLEWLCYVKMITIEIHREFDPDGKIIPRLNECGFRVMGHGELTIGVNKRYSNASHQ